MMKTENDKETAVPGVMRIVYVLMVILTVAFVGLCSYGFITGPDHTDKTTVEAVTARVLTSEEVKNFNLGAGLMGYVVGQSIGGMDKNAPGGGFATGLLFGAMAGMATAESQCKVALMVEGKPITIDVAPEAGKALTENQEVMIEKVTSQRLNLAGQVTSSEVIYRWPATKN